MTCSAVQVLKTLATFLSRHPGIAGLVVGDFNNYLTADLDTFFTGASVATLKGGPTPCAWLLLELGVEGCLEA